MGGKPKLSEVAQRAGVGLGTASNVINGLPVREDLQERVRKAAEDLGYERNPIAASLRKGSTQSFAMIVPEMENPLFSALVVAAQDAATARGYVVLASSGGDPKTEELHLKAALERRVDGLLLVHTVLSNERLKPLAAEMPIVHVSSERRIEGTKMVTIDQEAAGRMATEHLWRLGHRRIAFLAGPRTNVGGHARHRGYHKAMEAAGVTEAEEIFRRGSLNTEGGAETMRRLLADRSDVTGVVAATDLMALGAMQEIMRAGKRIPDDISLVGIDDIGLSPWFGASGLTTVRQPTKELGATAVEMALDDREDAPQDVILPITLIERGSARALVTEGTTHHA